ncbi:MAG: ABC transporter ATP-binding protein [Bacteroidota bacterium]
MNFRNLIWPFTKMHVGKIVLTFVVSTIAQLLIIVLPIYIVQSFDLLFGIQSHRAKVFSFLPDSWLASFHNYFILFTIILVLRGIFDFFERYIIGYVGELHLAYLRKKIFAHQLKMNMDIYDKKGFSKYLLRYSGDLSSIQSFITKGLIRFLSDVILLGLTLLVFFWIDQFIGITVLLVGAILAGITYWLNINLYKVSLKRRNTKSGLLKFVTARLQSIITIKAFNRVAPETTKYEKRVDRLLVLGKEYQKITSAIGAIIPFGLYLVMGGIMLGCWAFKNNSEITVRPESFFLALLLMITIMPVFRRCFRVNIIWRNGSISYRKLAEILLLPNEQTIEKSHFRLKKGEIVLQNIYFNYECDQQYLLDNFSINIPAGKMTVIKGENGCGKTTLLKLINGIYQPDKGSIKIDNIPISNLDPKSLRKKIAVVTDQCMLLGKTVFEAISYSRKPLNRLPASQMLEMLGISSSLELDDPIGELGTNLSNGQEKLLMYARAFLTQKPILLLDDPFVHLDEVATIMVVQYLNKIKSNRTIILFTSEKIPERLNIDAICELKKQAKLISQLS